MSDDVTVEETKKPEDTLKKLLESTASFNKSDKNGKSTSSAPWALIIAGIVAILFAVFGFVAVLARRKAAQLQHDLNVKEEEALQKKERASIEQHEEERKKIEEEVTALQDEINVLRIKRAKVEDRRIEFEDKISALTSWDDIELVETEE